MEWQGRSLPRGGLWGPNGIASRAAEVFVPLDLAVWPSLWDWRVTLGDSALLQQLRSPCKSWACVMYDT